MSDERERLAIRRRVVADNMECKSKEHRYNFSPEERLRLQQAADYIRADGERIKALEADIARLRSGLTDIAGTEYRPAYVEISPVGNWTPGSPYDRGAANIAEFFKQAARALLEGKDHG